MSGNGGARRPEPDGDVDPATPARGRTPPDGVPPESAHSRALSPPSPAEASGIAEHREQLAVRHQVAAERLRETAQRAMEHFDSASEGTQTMLDEWVALRDHASRTTGEDARFAALTGELLDVERRLRRQWDTLARMLREAAHHEASAQILHTGRYHD
ncbi:MAG TPA: hypothetical protein VKC57_17075 [Ktedonobacterales bacterium]|nr:hypothetical protein [Ktedonobacterales bacterium]